MMKKTLSLMLAVLTVIGLLSACVPQSSAPTSETTLPSGTTQPSTEPSKTDPTGESDPTDAATEPSTEATEPSTEPTEPSIEPTEPSSEPTEPVTKPTEPAAKPTEPTEPVTKPTEPAPKPPVHTHSYSSTVTKPTCTSGGYTTYVCACGDSYTSNPTAAAGHNYKSTVTAPTCTSGGYTTYVCKTCSHSYTDNNTSAAGHKWGNWAVTKDPTYTAAGTKERKCSACGKTESASIPKLEMGPSEMQQEVLRLVNIEREKAGLAPLEYVFSLQEAADLRASEIKQSFSHTRPDGNSCFTVLDGFNYYAAGENIAKGYRTPEAVVEGWMNSDGHRANILSPDFNGIVIGFEDYHWVQLFVGT